MLEIGSRRRSAQKRGESGAVLLPAGTLTIAAMGLYRSVLRPLPEHARRAQLLSRAASPALAQLPGAVSGSPAAAAAERTLGELYVRMDRARHRIIGSGGVFSAEDAYRKVRLGASLVQMMTALVRRAGRGCIDQPRLGAPAAGRWRCTCDRRGRVERAGLG
jgi:hypothetical protein